MWHSPRTIAVVVVAGIVVALVGVVSVQAEQIKSHLASTGPKLAKGMKPSTLGWGPDDRV